jgi:hypothetical protein
MTNWRSHDGLKTRRKKLLWIAPAAILGIALFSFLGGEIVKLLWNWLTPDLFGWREITFWQAFGLLALCRILFGSHGFHLQPRRMADRIADRMAERWAGMSPQEREWLRERIRGRCGFPPPAAEGESKEQ